jgi:hypothetical protein
MSYSFGVRAANKAEALAAVAAKFDEIIAQQPPHAADRAAVLANAGAVLDLLAPDDTKDVVVSLNGYVSWANPDDVTQLTAAAVSASAGYTPRET